MQLTGKQIVERGIVRNHCEAGVQQQGVDVRVESISVLHGYGIIPEQGKTTLPQTTKLPDFNGRWVLTPGYYELELAEGITMPNDAALYFKTRSSLVRSGAIVHSGQFDAGFSTEKAGCFLQVLMPITIEVGARVAQAIVHTSDPVENTYNGQYQGDKQRT